MSYEICCFFATDGKLANWQNLPEKIFTILFESVQNVHTGILCHLVERGDGYALSVAFQAVGKLFVAVLYLSFFKHTNAFLQGNNLHRNRSSVR